MRRPKSPAFIIVLLSVLVVAGIAAVYVLANVRSAWKSLPQMLSTAVSEQVNGKFTVGTVDVSVGSVVFRDVSLTSDEDGAKPVLEAETVRVSFGVTDLIHSRRDPVRAIDSIEIICPNVTLERGPDGRWNVADLFKPSARPKDKFKGQVIVRSGTVTVLDRKKPGAAENNAVGNVEGVIDFASAPVADYRLTAQGNAGRVGKVSVKGRFDFASESFDADLDGLSADASYWTKYPVHFKWIDVSSGRTDASMHLSRAEGEPFRYSAEFRLTDAAAQLKKMLEPARQVGGTIEVANNEVALDLRARLGSTPFLISGRVIGLRGSTLALDVQSGRANFREISWLVSVAVPEGMVLPTSGTILASLSGPSKKPTALFKLDGPALGYNGFSISGVHAEGSYSPQHVEIRSATGRAYGGSMEASGDFGWGPRKGISLHGRASGVRLSLLPSLKGRGIDAVTSGRFNLEWGASSGLGTYRGALTNGVIHGQEFSKGDIAVSYDGRNVRLDEVSAEMLGGKVAASGDILPGGGLDLQVSGAGIDLAAVQESYWSSPTVGTLQFNGNLTGTPESPAFDGQVEAYGAVAGGVSAERITADLELMRRRAELRHVEINDSGGTVIASGSIVNPFSAIPRLDLLLNIGSPDIERWAISAGLPFEASGSLSAELNVTRTLSNPDIVGSLRIENGMIAGVPLDSTVSRVRYHNSRLTVTGFEAHSGDGVLTAHGSLGFEDGAVGVSFEARDLPLDRLTGSWREYVLLAGGLNARGELTGSVKSAVLEASLDSDAIKINGQAFDAFQADLSWADDKLQIGRVSLTDGESSYSVSGSYSSADEKVELAAGVEDASIAQVIALIESGPLRKYALSVPRPFGGILDITAAGGIDLSGPRAVPDIHVKGSISDVEVGFSDIKTVRLEGDWQGETVRIDTLEALDGDTRLTAGGVFGPNGGLDLHGEARGLDLQSTSEWLRLDQNISGAADVTMIATGTAESPSVQATFDIKNPAIEGMRFDALHGRLSSVPASGSSESRINIDELEIELGDSRMNASGFLPVDWVSHSIPRDRHILVEAALNDDSLKLLSAFAGEAIKGQAGGSLSGAVSYSGTIENPILQGGLKWHDGSIQLAGLNSPFEQIEADVTLSGHTLSVDGLTGRSAEGGSFALSGPIDLAEMRPKLDLTVATSELRVSGKDISGRYGESIDVVVDSNLRITGDWFQPRIAGEIAVPEGTLGLGSAQDKRETETRKFDPGFDLRVTLGRAVVLKSAQIKTAVPGNISVGGSLRDPIVDGLVDLADGTITFPMRTFRILPGSDMQIRMSPGQPALAIVDMQARGSVVDYSPLGKRTKYSVTMQASGPLDKVHPTFTSSPVGLTEQRIVALVTGQYHFEQILKGNTGQDIGRELSGLFSSAVMPTVLGPLAQAFEEAFGFSEFALDVGYREPIQLSIGDLLGRDTYLSYSAVLGARPDYADSRYELKLSYRVRNNLEFSLQTDENKTVEVSAEGKIRF